MLCGQAEWTAVVVPLRPHVTNPKRDNSMPDHGNAEKDIVARAKSGNETEATTLLPMLVAGLVLIVVGAVVVMTFV